MNEQLDEIIETARKAIRVTDDKELDHKAFDIDKKSFISMGGAFDIIILLAQDIKNKMDKEPLVKD